jgi:hypothetical protein
MTIPQLLVLAALTIYAIYRQSIRHELTGRNRFKLALIYAIVGLVVGGFETPSTTQAWLIAGASLVLSLVVGIARGRLTRVWRDADGKVWTQGTWLTIALFLVLVGAKWIYGTYAYLRHEPVAASGGFGEILVMIAIMIAVQAEIVHRRALPLLTAPTASPASA